MAEAYRLYVCVLLRGGQRELESTADAVDGVALGGGTAGPVRRADEVLRVEPVTVVRAGHARDRLLHERPAEVVDPPSQRLGGGVEAHLHPARLKAPDGLAESQPEGRGVLEVLLARDLLDPVR